MLTDQKLNILRLKARSTSESARRASENAYVLPLTNNVETEYMNAVTALAALVDAVAAAKEYMNAAYLNAKQTPN